MRALWMLGLLLAGQAIAPAPTIAPISVDPKITAFAATLTKAEAGDAESEFTVGDNYERGISVQKDPVKALPWLQKAADQNDPQANGDLGWAYNYGIGVAKDPVKAFTYYLRGAQADNAYCQRMTAEYYDQGKGVARDPVSAVAWFKKAAVQDDVYGQGKVGEAYRDGLGVPKDEKLAFTYFLAAAVNNSGWAQYIVGRSYYDGLFVPRDVVQSYMWCKIAEATYHDPAEATAVSAFLKILKPEQIAEGDKLAQSWQNDHSFDQKESKFRFTSGRRARFPMEYKDGNIFLLVGVQGHPALRFILDTGAYTVMSDDLAAKLQIEGHDYLPLLGYGPDFLLATVATHLSLALPGLNLDDVKMPLVPLGYLENSVVMSGRTVDGILGLDLLRQFVIRLDYVNHTIEFIDPADFEPSPADAIVPMNLQTDRAYVEAQLENNGATSDPIELLVDTGASNALNLAKRTADAWPQLNLNTGPQARGYSLAGTISARDTLISSLRIESLVLPGPTASVAEDNRGVWSRGSFGVIGNEIWHRFDVTFDFPNRKIYLKKNSFFDESYDGYETGLSLTVGADQKTLSVLDIVPGSPAAKAGFHIDDVLLQIDGLDMKSISTDDSRDRFRKPGLHHVVVNRNGAPVVLDLVMGNSRSAGPPPVPQ